VGTAQHSTAQHSTAQHSCSSAQLLQSDWQPCSCSQNSHAKVKACTVGLMTRTQWYEKPSNCNRRYHCNTFLQNESPTLAFCKTCMADAADWPCGLKPPRTLMDWGSSPTCPITAMPDSTTARTDAALWGPPPAVKESSDQNLDFMCRNS